jgi:hypothetical protein
MPVAILTMPKKIDGWSARHRTTVVDGIGAASKGAATIRKLRTAAREDSDEHSGDNGAG